MTTNYLFSAGKETTNCSVAFGTDADQPLPDVVSDLPLGANKSAGGIIAGYDAVYLGDSTTSNVYSSVYPFEDWTTVPIFGTARSMASSTNAIIVLNGASGSNFSYKKPTIAWASSSVPNFNWDTRLGLGFVYAANGFFACGEFDDGVDSYPTIAYTVDPLLPWVIPSPTFFPAAVSTRFNALGYIFPSWVAGMTDGTLWLTNDYHSWTQVLPANSFGVGSSCFCIIGDGLGNGFASNPTHLWRTTNFGVSWTDISAGLPGSSMARLCYLSDTNRFYNGLHSTGDLGATWDVDQLSTTAYTRFDGVLGNVGPSQTTLVIHNEKPLIAAHYHAGDIQDFIDTGKPS